MKIPQYIEPFSTWAEFYHRLGFCVIPLAQVTPTKKPLVKWGEYQKRRPSLETLDRWFLDGTARGYVKGIAIVCGKVSGNIVRVDFDDPDDFDRVGGVFDGWPVFKSQRQGGGYGVLLKTTKPFPTIPQKTLSNYPKLEFRATGAITVLPPTPGYKWVSGPCVEGINNLHAVNLQLLLKQVFKYDTNAPKVNLVKAVVSGDVLTDLLQNTEVGERSNNLVRIASMLRARGIDSDSALQVMKLNFDQYWDKTDMSWDEAENTFQEAYHRYAYEGVRVTGLPPLTDNVAPRARRVKFSQIKAGVSRELIHKLVMSGAEGNTVLAAPTKMGKTSLLLDACISASKGKPVWGTLEVARPLTIAFIDQELKYLQLKENQELMAPVVGYPDENRLQVLYHEDGQFRIDDPEGLEWLWNDLNNLKPDLVVLDGWGWFVNHQASKSELVMPALAWWKGVRQALNCATIMIHHYKKEQVRNNYESEWIDNLDMIEGLKRFSDQAQTSIGYTQIPHYDTYGLLKGRTNHSAWEPLQIVIDYDYTTLTHRVVNRDEGAELFDPDMYRKLWEVSTDSRWLKGALNTIQNRLGLTQAELAKELGLPGHSQISKWRSGLREPSSDKAEKIRELYNKAKSIPMKQKQMPRGKR